MFQRKYWIFMLSLLLSGCFVHQDEIRGRVIDSDSGAPIADAAVAVVWHARFHSWVESRDGCLGGVSTTTDKNGEFRIPSWTLYRSSVAIESIKWQAYKAGYLISVQSLPSRRGRDYALQRLPTNVVRQGNAEYILRYLDRAAGKIGDSGCNSLPTDERIDGHDINFPFRQAMTAEAGAKAKSDYELYLVQSIKASLGSGLDHAGRPQIDIRKFNPYLDPRASGWVGDDASIALTMNNIDQLSVSPELIVLCAKPLTEKSLKGADCDVNTRRVSGNTLLMDKVDNGEIVEYLLQNGADPGILNVWTGNNALSLLMKHARLKGTYNAPSTIKAMRLLTADPRTTVTRDVRLELGDPKQWRMAEPTEKDFFLEARERIQTLPDAMEIARFDEKIIADIQLRNHYSDEGWSVAPFQLR